MAKHIKINKYKARLITVSVILCIAAVLLAYIKFADIVPYYIEKQETVVIHNTEELLANKDSLYNDDCALTGDVHVRESNICLGGIDRRFTGTFDGNGYTVYIDLEESADGFSLFGKIAEGAVIKNVNFVFSSFDVSSQSYGGIATSNEGVISNCSVSFEVGITRAGTFSPLVTTNKGEISNIVAEGAFINCGVAESSEDKVFTGALCVYNYGTVKNAVVTADFSGFTSASKLDVLRGDKVNNTIAAVDYSDIGEGETSNINVLIADTLFAADNSDSFYSLNDKDKVFSENNVFVALDFDNRFWQLDGGKLTLINTGNTEG